MNRIDLKRAWDAAANPPAGWQGSLYFYNNLDRKIRYGYAPAQNGDNSERKGTIVLTHGYAEHVDLYFETIKKYQSMGYDVWGMDWQGHGLSDRDDPEQPLKPGSGSMERHVEDLDFFVNNVVKTRHDPQTPLIMSTHSMGGHVGLLYLQKHPGIFDGAVMSAPMYDIYRLGLGKWARPLVKLAFNIASNWLGLRDAHIPSTESMNNFFGRISTRLSHLFNHRTSVRGEIREAIRELTPQAKLGRPTFGWVSDAFDTIDLSIKKDFLKSIETPILIGSADNEDLVDNRAHKQAVRLIPNAEHIEIANAGHGLWFEDDGPFNTWWNRIASFTEKLEAHQPHKAENREIADDVMPGRKPSYQYRPVRSSDLKQQNHMDSPLPA